MILSRAAPRLLATVLATVTTTVDRSASFILYHPPFDDPAGPSTGGFGIVTLQEDNVNDQRLKVALSPQVKVLKCGRAVPESEIEPPVTRLAAGQRRRRRGRNSVITCSTIGDSDAPVAAAMVVWLCIAAADLTHRFS
jgi:hypothetical protein